MVLGSRASTSICLFLPGWSIVQSDTAHSSQVHESSCMHDGRRSHALLYSIEYELPRSSQYAVPLFNVDVVNSVGVKFALHGSVNENVLSQGWVQAWVVQ